MHSNLVFGTNVYEHWDAHQHDAGGLWIIRNSWAQWVANVRFIEPYKGPAPYYGNPKVTVDIYFHSGKFLKSEILRCPGTGGYARVPPPSWSNVT